MRTFAVFIVVLAVITPLFIHWSEIKTQADEQAYATYAQCVQDTYGVSPVEFYQVYGKPAKCHGMD